MNKLLLISYILRKNKIKRLKCKRTKINNKIDKYYLLNHNIKNNLDLQMFRDNKFIMINNDEKYNK